MITTKIPDRNNDPYNTSKPLVCPIKIIGAQTVNVHPKTIGSPVPVILFACKNVATPHKNIYCN